MSLQDLTRVPGRGHYSLKYVQDNRIFSYAHQIDTVTSFHPREVIEIGAGPGVVTAALRSLGIEVITVDVQPELHPDVVASVTELPFSDKQVDVVLCCQVLEHLPFTQFTPALKELWRVCRRGLIISLPDASPYYEFRMRLPKLPRLNWSASRKKDPGKAWRRNKWDTSGHYWEIGYSETSLSIILKSIHEAIHVSPRTWRVSEKHYHRFFCLEKPT